MIVSVVVVRPATTVFTTVYELLVHHILKKQEQDKRILGIFCFYCFTVMQRSYSSHARSNSASSYVDDYEPRSCIFDRNHFIIKKYCVITRDNALYGNRNFFSLLII